MAGEVRLDQESNQLNAIVRLAQELDAQDSKRDQDGQRIAPALNIEYADAGVPMAITHPGGGRVVTQVTIRAIWKDGVALIHRSFLHTGTRCEISLTTRLLRRDELVARVSACRFLSGSLHDIRLAFERSVDLSDYIKDHIEVARVLSSDHRRKELAGHVVYLDPIEAEHHLFEYNLRETKLDVVYFSRLGRAMDYLRQHATKMFVCELDLEEAPGEEAIQTARDAEYKGGVLAVTSDPSRADRTRDAGADGVLVKPYTRDALVASLRTIIARAETGRIRSDICDDQNASIALHAYFEFLHGLAPKFRSLIHFDDVAALRAELLRLRGSGTSFGYRLLTTTANDAVTRLDQTSSIKESIPEIDCVLDLISTILASRTKDQA